MTNPAETTPSTESAATGSWTLDQDATTVALRHKTMWGLVNVKGAFTGVTGEGEVGADGSAHGSVTLDATSLDTGHAKRDAHLRSADFFDTDRYPTLVFTADSATPDARGNVEVAGRLTVHGTTRPLAFSARTTESTATAITLTAEIDVDRADFGLTWNKGGMIKGPATLALTVRFVHLPA
ncbi:MULTISPECIES: YceI family protein [unclassified Streptomyces]|uniref:YceI family protein n=1 Tax=unclassified Streptomyces TaxID=2593676 RepID=UPI002E117F84|nr:YceI family protein [Streptomyces sp. NBC_01320]